jgi:hypothetical protein
MLNALPAMREAEPSRVCLGGFIILKSLLADAVTDNEGI